jgi:guanylate kinase
MADMSHWTEFDHVIINDELDEAVAALEAVLRGEGDASRSDTADLREKVQKILV